jgi:CRP-like cAMP-binding protein
MTASATQTAFRSLRENLAPMVSFGAEAWKAAESKFCLRQFYPGEHLVQAGEVVGNLFFITTGLARFYYVNADGREFNKSFSGAGQVVSSLSSLAVGEPSPFFVQALSPLVALSIRYGDLLALTARFPEWSALRVILLERLVIGRERREADLLLLSATERYRKFNAEFPGLAGSIPNYHIASYLGITEVALSRIRRQMGLTRVNASPAE